MGGGTTAEQGGFLTLTRRGFLGSAAAVPISSMLMGQGADDDGLDDVDLTFDLSDDRERLVIQVLAQNPVRPKKGEKERPPVVRAVWILKREQFGPDARFALRDISNARSRGYELRVLRARFGRMFGRTCLITFKRLRLRQRKGPDGRRPLRFGMWMAPGIFSRSTAPSQDAGVYMENYGVRAFNVDTGAPRPIPLRDFIGGQALQQNLPARRLAVSMRLMFNGHWRVPDPRRERSVQVTVGPDIIFAIDSDWDTPQKPFAIHPGLALTRTRFFWARGTADKVFGDADETAKGEAAAEDQLGFWGEGVLAPTTGAMVFARDKGPQLALSVDGGDPATRCYFRIDVPAERTAVSEVSVPGLWRMDLEGEARTATRGYEKLRGRLMERAYGPAGATDADIAGQAGSLSFDAEFDDTRMRVMETPIGRARLRGREREAPPLQEGEAPPQQSLQESAFGPRRGQAITVLHSWGPRGGTRARPRLEWVEINALLIELEQAVIGADFSRLSFEPMDLRLFYHRASLPYPVLNSAIRLGADAGTARAHIDLSRARLKAQRAHDLLSLHFEFSDLALVWGDGPPELRSLNPSCRIGAPREGGEAADTRPVLVVEFPGQHVFEQALFAPKPPPLPDRRLPQLAMGVNRQTGKRAAEGEVDLPAERPKAVGIVDGFLIFDPNSRPQVVDMLAMLPRPLARKTAREAIRDAKIAAWRADNPPPDRQSAVVGDFEALATDYAGAANDLVRRNKLPVDQTVYIGGFALEADAMARVRTVWTARIAGMVTDAVAGTFDALNEALAGLTAQAQKAVGYQGAAASTEMQRLLDFKGSAENSLLMEARLEAAVPGYQLFRNFYREARVRAYLDGLSCGAPDAPVEPTVAEIEYFFSPDHLDKGAPVSRPWLQGQQSASVLRDRAVALITRYAEDVLVNDVGKIIREETKDGLVEGRLANPSRLAFRVPCSDGIDAARLGIVGLDHDDDARVSQRRAAIAFDLDALTNFSAFEMSVLRRAQVIYDADEAGRTDPGSRRQQNLSAGAMLDHLGFAQGRFVNSATRLGDVQNALRQPPSRLETAIEMPARLILSPNQDAVVLTPTQPPLDMFDAPGGPLAARALWTADFVTDSIDPGLRAVHSPDLRPDFVWQRNHRNMGVTVPRLPGGAAPPRGPLAPWFIPRHATDAPDVSPLAIAEPYRTIDTDVDRIIGNANGDEVAFCAAVVDTNTEGNRRLALPHLVNRLCQSILDRARGNGSCSDQPGVDRRFRGPTDAFMRHELVLLTSAWGLPVTGRRTLQGQLSAFSSQAEPENRHRLMDIGPGSALYVPRTLAVSELSLSALGGSLRHDTSFEPPAAAKGLRQLAPGNAEPLFDALSIERWQQWTVLGRDIFCEVVFKGFLFPLGHRASLVQVTERSLLRDDSGAIRAYLRQRMFIRIGRPEKSYPGIAHPHSGREFPVDRLTLLTTQTPDIVDPSEAPSSGGGEGVIVAAGGRVQLGTPGLVFWPRTAPIEAANVRFDLDVDAQVTDMPLIFVDNIAANDPETLAGLVRYYNALPHPDAAQASAPLERVRHLRTMALGGQKWRYAPETKAGSASVETDHWTLKATGREDALPAVPDDAARIRAPKQVAVVRFTNGNFDFDPVLQGADQPPFYPAVSVTRLRLRQAERMMGRSVPPVRASYDMRFVETGFPALAPNVGSGDDTAAAAGTETGQTDTPQVVPGNASEVYLAFHDHPPQGMGDKGDQSGGVFRPSGLMVAASRAKGILSFDQRLSIPSANANAAYADAFNYTPLPAVVPEASAAPGAPAPRSATSVATNTPAEQSKFAEVTQEVREIYKKLFASDAKILGLVSIKDLMDVLEQLQDPKSGMPELAENIRYGAGQLQSAADDATEAAQSAVEFVRLRVVKPLSEAVEDVREGWNAIEKRLVEQQSKVLSGDIQPFTFKEILPELDDGLTGLDAALRESVAITDEIEFALSLGQVYEAGRRFLDALKRTAANPAERIETAFKERFQVVKSIFDALQNGLEDGLQALAEAFLKEGQAQLKARIITLVLPKGDGAGDTEESLRWAFKPVHLPLLAELSKALPANAPQPDQLQPLVNKALAEVYLERSEAEAVLDAFLEHLFDNNSNPDGFFEAKTDLFDVSFLNLALPTHGEQIRALLETRANRAVATLKEGAADLGADVENYLADQIAELEQLVARLAQEAQDAAITYVIEEFGAELAWLLDVYNAANELQAALKDRKIGRVLQALIELVELFIGPTGLSAEALCKEIDGLFGWLDAFFGAIRLDALKLAETPTNKTLCTLGNDGRIAPEHAPPGGETDTLAGRLYALHGEIGEATTALADPEIREKLEEAVEKLEGDKLADIRTQAGQYVLRLNTTAGAVRVELDNVYRAVATMYCELRNDAIAVDAMAAQLNGVFTGARCGSRPDEILAKVQTLPRELKTFADRRARMMRTMVDQLRIVTDAITDILANRDVQLLLGAGALYAALDDEIEDLTDEAKATIADLKARVERLRAREAGIAAKAAGMLARAANAVQQVTEQAVKLAQDIEGLAADIRPLIDIVGIESNVETIRAFDSYVKTLAQALETLAADPAADFAKLKAISVANGPPALSFFTIDVSVGDEPARLEQEFQDVRKRGLALLRAYQRQIENELKNLEGLARKAMRAAEKEVLKELDGFAMTVLETDFKRLVGAGSGNVTLTLISLYSDVLEPERKGLYDRLTQPIFAPVRNKLLAPVDPGVPEKDGVWPIEGDDGTLKLTNDRLAAEVIWFKHIASSRTPISDEGSRDFLKYFFESWGSTPTPIVIAEQLTNFVADIFKGDLLKAIDLNLIRQQIEEYLLDLIPDEIAMQYTYGVLLGEPVKEATLGIFAPAADTRLDITAKIVLHLNPSNPEVKFRSVGTLGAFDIKLVGDIFDALTLKFRGAEFTTEAGQKPRFDIDYDDYEIGPELEFVQDLQSIMSPKEGSGAFILPSFAPPSVEAGYKLQLGLFSIGVVSFFNISLNTSAILPFTDNDARFRASLSTRDDPFTISYLPYGGSGFFAIEANTNGIVGFEAGFEFGGAAAFGFGPLTGEGRLMAGFYIRQVTLSGGRKLTEIQGTFFVGGSASIWIFSFGASLSVRLGMVNGDMSGEAVFTYSFSIGIKDFDFSVTVWKQEGKGFSGSPQAALTGGTRFAANSAFDPSGNRTVLDPRRTAVVEAKVDCACDRWRGYTRYFEQPKNPKDFF
ncbi:MAG: hypothetical protein AAFQ58_12085 [Pseudomonadota bacterium]